MRPGLPAALALLACTALPAAGQGQESHALVVPHGCVVPDSEMKHVPVYTWVNLPDSASPTFRALAENLMQDLVERVPALLGGRPDVLPSAGPSVHFFDLSNSLDVIGHRNGRITWRPAVDANAGAATILGRALDAASADGTLFPWDSSMAGDSVRFRISFVWPGADSASRERLSHVQETAIPVFSIPVPILHQVQPEPGNRPPPYPDDAAYSGYNATVIMQFVVDTSGRADMATAHDVWPKDKPPLDHNRQLVYNEFVQEILQRLPEFRFHPASLGLSCRLRQVVSMPFVFTHSR